MREENRCCHMGYSFWLAARFLLFAPFHWLEQLTLLNYLSFQPVLHSWCNKGHGMCYPVCGMMHIKVYSTWVVLCTCLMELSYFLFQPVLHNWCNKGCGMCYPVCGIVHIKEPLLLTHVAEAGFLSQSEWSFTISLTPYN